MLVCAKISNWVVRGQNILYIHVYCWGGKVAKEARRCFTQKDIYLYLFYLKIATKRMIRNQQSITTKPPYGCIGVKDCSGSIVGIGCVGKVDLLWIVGIGRVGKIDLSTLVRPRTRKGG